MNKFNRGIFALLAGIGISAFSMRSVVPSIAQPVGFGNRKQKHGPKNPSGTKLARKAAKGSLGIAVIR